MGHQTLSKAPEMSKRSATTYPLLKVLIILRIYTLAFSVDLPALKPNCLSDRAPGTFNTSSKHDLRSFSNSLPITGRRHIGLYDFGSFSSLSSLFRRTLNDHFFQIEGKTPHRRHPLNNLTNWFVISLHASFISRTSIRSGPGALLFLKVLAAAITSTAVNSKASG